MALQKKRQVTNLVESKDIVEAKRKAPMCYLIEQLYKDLVSFGILKRYKRLSYHEKQKQKVIEVLTGVFEEYSATVTIPDFSLNVLITNPEIIKTLSE